MNWNNLSSICFSQLWCQWRSWERPPGVFRETHCSHKPWEGISLPSWPARYAVNHTVCFSYIPSAFYFCFVYWLSTLQSTTVLLYSPPFSAAWGLLLVLTQVIGHGENGNRCKIHLYFAFRGMGTSALVVLWLQFAWGTCGYIFCPGGPLCAAPCTPST